jgi:hypothetical protein
MKKNSNNNSNNNSYSNYNNNKSKLDYLVEIVVNDIIQIKRYKV